MTSSLQNGMLVLHASLGPGRVVALDRDAVHVFFPGTGEPFATKLRLPLALTFLTPSTAPDARLSELPAFTLDASTGRWARAGASLTHAVAVARFLELFPGGFSDPRHAGVDGGERAPRWRRAQAAFADAFGDGRAERLLAAGDPAAILEATSRIERLVRPLQPRADRTSLADGPREPGAVRAVLAALLEVIAAAPGRARFEALAAAVAALVPGAAPGARWPAVTLLPFVARPEAHMLLRPPFTRDALVRLGLDLAYDPEPSWTTYEALLASTGRLLERLRPLGARDHFDVEAFLHAAAARAARVKPAAARAGAAGSRGHDEPGP